MIHLETCTAYPSKPVSHPLSQAGGLLDLRFRLFHQMAASIPATINDLPDELINGIVSEDCLSAKDLFNLLLTSRRFSSITGQWLYHTFDTIATKAGSRSSTSRHGLWGIVEKFAYTMALHPDRASQVKKIRLQGVAGIWSGSQYTYTAAEDDPLIEAARKTGIITEGNFFNLGRGDGGLEFLLILFLTPNLTELEIYQPSRYRSLKQIRHAVLNPSPPTSMGSRS